MTRDDLQATLPVARALEALGIPYYIGGSIGSSTHGVGRSTQDVDIIAQLTPEHVDRLVARLQNAYYLDAQMMHDAIRRRGSFNLIHLATMYKVDVFIPKQRPFDRSAFSRTVLTRPFEGSDEQFPIASAEDAILSKLEWYRAGGETSERQWKDILGIMKVQRDALSSESLERWGRELGVSDLLVRARREVMT